MSAHQRVLGAGCLPRAEQRQRIGGLRRGDMAEVGYDWSRKRSTSLHFVFFEGSVHGREQDRGSRSTRKHTAAAQTHGLRVCADVACSWCSCSAGSTRVLGVAVLRTHRIAIARLRPALGPLPGGKTNTFFPSTHHNIELAQALGVLLRSGSIGLGLTFVARLMVVLRVIESFGIGFQKNMPQVQKWLQRRHSEKE